MSFEFFLSAESWVWAILESIVSWSTACFWLPLIIIDFACVEIGIAIGGESGRCTSSPFFWVVCGVANLGVGIDGALSTSGLVSWILAGGSCGNCDWKGLSVG